MDFLDETLNKAKEVFDVAKQKTTEVYNVGKQKYDISAMENTLTKLYTAFGKAAFAYFNENGTPEKLQNAAATIEKQISRITEAKEELAKMRKSRICPVCGKTITESSTFCNFCGAKLEFKDGE